MERSGGRSSIGTFAMARASNIYFVMSHPAGRVLGAFTVKHEMIKALAQLPNERMSVYRYPDGLLNLRHLMGEGLCKDFIDNL